MPESIGGRGVTQARRTLFGRAGGARLRRMERFLEPVDRAPKLADLLFQELEALVVAGALSLDTAIQLVEDDVGALEDLPDHLLVEAVAVNGHPGVNVVQASVSLDQLVRERLHVSPGRSLPPDPLDHGAGELPFEELAKGLHVGSLATAFVRTSFEIHP
jgi:hypothetical protein